MMRRGVGHDDYDALGLGPKRKAGRVGQSIELIFRDIAAATCVQTADPVGELLDIGGHRVAVGAIAVRIFRNDVILEGNESEAIVAIVGGEVLRERDHVLLHRVDIGLHRLGDIEHEHDIDRTALADTAEVNDLGELAVLVNFDVIGPQIADRVAVLIGEPEVELDAAVGVKMFETRVAYRNLEIGARGSCRERQGSKYQDGKGELVGALKSGFHVSPMILRITTPISQDQPSRTREFLAFSSLLGYPKR